MNDKTITTSKTLKLKIPSLPNFIKVDDSNEMIHVSELSKESIDDIADAWRRAFREHCKGPWSGDVKPLDLISIRKDS